jgi:hypothetical protein
VQGQIQIGPQGMVETQVERGLVAVGQVELAVQVD